MVERGYKQFQLLETKLGYFKQKRKFTGKAPLSTSKNLMMLEQLGLTHLTQAPILSLFLFKILDSLENVMILSLVKSFPVSY